MSSILRSLFRSGELRSIVSRHIILLETSTVRGRSKPIRFLENDGFAVARGRRRGESDTDAVLGERNTDATPEGTLEREEEARDYGSRGHD